MSVSAILLLGAFVVIVACTTPMVRPSISSVQTIAIALCGLVLIVLSDPSVINFKCNLSEGCGFDRTGAPPGEQIKGLAKAETDAGLAKFGQELEPKFKEINYAVKQLQGLLSSTSSMAERNLSPAPLPSSTISVPPAVSSTDEKGVVLVYFKDGQEQKANTITEALRKAGYKSSATNSNLREIQQWSQKTDQGFIQVAVAGENDALAKDLRRILLSISRDSSVAVDTGWSFRASKAQIYLF